MTVKLWENVHPSFGNNNMKFDRNGRVNSRITYEQALRSRMRPFSTRFACRFLGACSQANSRTVDNFRNRTTFFNFTNMFRRLHPSSSVQPKNIKTLEIDQNRLKLMKIDSHSSLELRFSSIFDINRFITIVYSRFYRISNFIDWTR